MRRLVAAVLLVGVGVVAGQGFASAQVYPPVGATLVIDPSIIGCNDGFVASGTGWLPGTTVTFTLAPPGQSLGSVTAQGNGTFAQGLQSSTTLDIGQHTVTASGLDASGVQQSIPTLLNVSTCSLGAVATRVPGATATRSGTGGLAFTGADNTGLIVGIAVLLILIGTVLGVAFTRRRRA